MKGPELSGVILAGGKSARIGSSLKMAGADCTKYSSPEYDLKLPDFPDQSLQFKFDLCAGEKNKKATRIWEFKTSSSDPGAITKWYGEVKSFVNNFGNLKNFRGDPALDYWWEEWAYYQARIVKHKEAMDEELGSMKGWRFDKCKAINKTIGFVTGAIITIGTAGGGTAAMLSSLLVYAGVELGGHALEASGADRRHVELIKTGFGFGSAAVAGKLSGELVKSLTLEGIATSLAAANETVWGPVEENLKKCFPYSVDRINTIRSTYVNNVNREMKELCRIRNSVDTALKQINSELDDVNNQVRKYREKIRADFYRENGYATRDCQCCRYGNGSSPAPAPVMGPGTAPVITPSPPDITPSSADSLPTTSEVLKAEASASAKSQRDESGCSSTLTVSFSAQDLTGGKTPVIRILVTANGQVWHDSGNTRAVIYSKNVSKQVACGQVFNIQLTATNINGQVLTVPVSVTTPIP